MRYAVIKVINGNYFIHAEGMTDINQAKVTFHGLCQMLWNAPDVITATVAIIDEQQDVVEGYKELIRHEPEPQPEPEQESQEEGDE